MPLEDPSWLKYEWECLKGALKGHWGNADTITAILGYAVSPFGLLYPDPEEWGRAASWAPSVVFALVLLGRISWNISRSAYLLHKAQNKTIRELAAEIERRKELKPTQEALDELSRLLDVGIHEILNGKVRSADDANSFFEYEKKWLDKLFQLLDTKFTQSDAVHVKRLGTVPVVSFPHVMGGTTWVLKHEKVLREFALREQRIRDLIKRGPVRA